MVKAVLFDLDGTLLDRDTSVRQFISAQYDRLTEHLSYIPKQDYTARFIELDCHGHVWKDKVYQDLVAESVIYRGQKRNKPMRSSMNSMRFLCCWNSSTADKI